MRKQHLCFSRQKIDELIASKPKPAALEWRLLAVERAIATCEKFYCWPALIESFELDAKRLKLAYEGAKAPRK